MTWGNSPTQDSLDQPESKSSFVRACPDLVLEQFSSEAKQCGEFAWFGPGWRLTILIHVKLKVHSLV